MPVGVTMPLGFTGASPRSSGKSTPAVSQASGSSTPAVDRDAVQDVLGVPGGPGQKLSESRRPAIAAKKVERGATVVDCWIAGCAKRIGQRLIRQGMRTMASAMTANNQANVLTIDDQGNSSRQGEARQPWTSDRTSTMQLNSPSRAVCEGHLWCVCVTHAAVDC